MTVTLNYTTLAETVDRQLSIIGKRSTDDNGNLLFKDITLGTREKDLITDYIRQAVIDFSVETAAFITAEVPDTSITLTFPSNHNAVLESFIQQSCNAYCVSYTLYSWFTVTAPRIAEKYLDDCKRQLAAVIRLVNEKKAPTGTSDVLSTTTVIS